MRYLLNALISGFLFVALVQASAAQEQPEKLESQKQAEPIMPPENNSVVSTGETLDRLFESLRKDIDSNSASATAGMIWREWSSSGSKSIDLLMNWAGKAMGLQDFAKAQDLLDHVVVIAPDYAEGWNRRATLYFSMNDFGRSLADIETTLALEPRHFGAISGLASIMQRVGKKNEALEAWYRVLAVYPANKQAQKAVIDLEEELAGSRI
jgi:tetratricopeptide (TPR) repeat protein